VFEIGSSLREARSRRGLALPQVERDTHIRGRYLTALEEEQFDVLPAPAYVRGFLRTYAEYLGLDGQQFVDQYNSRFAPGEDPVAAPPTPILRARWTRRRRLVLVLPVAAVLGLGAWQLAGGGGGHRRVAATTATTRIIVTKVASAGPAPQVAARTPRAARITLRATRGPCWLTVRLGSASGPVLFETTLQPGQTARFVGRRLWIRFGAPWNLDATLGGKRLRLPATTGDAVVTASGLAGAA
jgi:cytoskeleton protein RodZ